MEVLTKTSSSEEVKSYFKAILKLQSASEKFPVNLDEVWNLVYERKDSTVQIASAHETSTIFSYNGNDILLNQKKSLFLFDYLLNCCTFAVRHFYIHTWFVDFLCPQISYCLQYKQRFLRTYSPTSQYESVATWRNSLLSYYIINF